MLFQYVFPVSDYYGENIFEQQVFIESEKYLSFQDVFNFLIQLDKEQEIEQEGNYNEDRATTIKKCLVALSQIENNNEFPVLNENLSCDWCGCETEFGLHPLICRKIVPCKI